MIDLYQYQRVWGLLNASPFCMKLEVYLRLANIPYQTHTINNPRRAPKGKLPYVKDGDHVIADSTLIIEYLKAKYGDVLDQGLTPRQRAEAWAIQVLLEDHLYWLIVYSRWVDPDGWKVAEKTFFGNMPRILRAIIPPLVRKKVKNILYAQGLGRHTHDEITVLGQRDLTAIANYLPTQGFMFGELPTSIDACIYAFLSAILYTPIHSPLQTHAIQLSTLNAYCDRMKNFLDI